MFSIGTPILLLSAMVLLTIILMVPETDAAATAVIDIEETTVWVDVSPGSFGVETIDVSVRSSSARNVILDLHYEISGPTTWAVDGEQQLFMEPLARKSFSVDIIVPLGELAVEEGELTITAVVEGEPSLDVGSDSVQIRIMEYRSIEPVIDDEYILDLPPEGELELPVQNTGNTPVSFILFIDDDAGPIPGDMEYIEIGPGNFEYLSIPYSLDTSLQEQEVMVSMHIMDEGIDRDMFSLEFLREGEIFHLLFGEGPFLVLIPGQDIGQESVSVLSLGGDLTNIGLEIVQGPENAYIDQGNGPDIQSLHRRTIEYETGGFTGREMLTIRAYGYSGDRKIGSNSIIIAADGAKLASGPLITTQAAVAGGSAAAAMTTAAGTAAYLYSASEIFKYRWLLLTLVPLYSMTKGEKVLDHFFRGRLFEYIKENPGVTFTALKEHFDVKNGTLTYHLHKLEREELITYRNLGKYKLFYADGMRIRGCEVVISPLDKDILNLVSENPGITTKSVISTLRTSRSQRTLSRHIKQLERKGFLIVERSHGARRLFISKDMERVLMPHQGVVEVAEVIGSEA